MKDKEVEARVQEMVAQELRQRAAAGGRATARNRTARERSEAARKAVTARWAATTGTDKKKTRGSGSISS